MDAKLTVILIVLLLVWAMIVLLAAHFYLWVLPSISKKFKDIDNRLFFIEKRNREE